MDLERTDIKVSVIIAVYNSGKYLRKTMESVCAQSLKEIEIICVDDGSTDESLSILEEYAQADKRITVLRQTKPSDGAAAARNLGLIHAQGVYLSILDSDDFFEADMLEKAYQRAIETDSDVVIYDGYIFDSLTKVDREAGFILHPEYLPEGKIVFSPKENADRIFQMTLGAAWNCLIRRKFTEDHKIRFQSFHHADDLGFVYVAFVCANRISVLNERLVHYRLNNANSQASNISKWPETACQALMQLKNELLLRKHFEEYKASFAQEVMIYAIFYLDGMRDYKAFECLYNELRDRYLEELGVFDVPDYKYINPYWLKIRNAIRDMTTSEYLYRRMYGLPPFTDEAAWRKQIPDKSRIVIYGAGNVGTDIFGNLIKEKKIQIKAWVDRQYLQIGYPVVSPEIIKKLDFDYCLIAVVAEYLYETIRDYLLECGLHKEQICWIGEKNG